MGLRAPGGPGRGERVLKEDLRKKLESWEGKAREPKKVMRVFRVLESWRKRPRGGWTFLRERLGVPSKNVGSSPPGRRLGA